MAALATRQHGIVTRAQLAEIGLSGSAIDRRIRAGRLIVLHPGVFAVGHAALSIRGRWLAATFACGANAVLSHGTAAALWEVMAGQPRKFHVTVPGTAGRDMPRGVRLHRYRSLDPAHDVTVCDGIPVTTVARTLLDLSTYLPMRFVRRGVRAGGRPAPCRLRGCPAARRRASAPSWHSGVCRRGLLPPT